MNNKVYHSVGVLQGSVNSEFAGRIALELKTILRSTLMPQTGIEDQPDLRIIQELQQPQGCLPDRHEQSKQEAKG